MTDYNDENWHGWNGGECPVHPETMVEVILLECEELSNDIQLAKVFVWDATHFPIIAFRVVKEHREPREWWIVGSTAYDNKEDAVRMAKDYGGEFIHVREVLE